MPLFAYTSLYMIMGSHQLLYMLKCAVPEWITERQMTPEVCVEFHLMALQQQPAGPASFILMSPPEEYSGCRVLGKCSRQVLDALLQILLLSIIQGTALIQKMGCC